VSNLTVVGLDKHLSRLRKISDNVEKGTVPLLLEMGEMVRQYAMASIRDGTVRGPGHIPSKPGEPPKGDSGVLELNIVVELRASEKTVNIISTAPYSSALEFGTSSIAPRPFLRPALRANRSRFVTGMAMLASGTAMTRVYKNSTRTIDEANTMTGRT
jgi:HK97 gp10 family phage protein